jgi:stage V sporulation protein SpoVS
VGSADRDELVLGFLAAPGRPTEIAGALAEDLPPQLADRVTDTVRWRVPVRTDRGVAHIRQGVEAIDLAREHLLRDGWDMAVCITDTPLRIGRRPVVADASATHGVALISLPALGAVQTRRRARDAVIRLVDGLVGESLELGESGPKRRARVSHRIASLAAPIRAVEPPDDDIDLRFVAAVVRGNLRLLAGMVRTNRPWRLIVRLSRALAAAAAAVVFALVTADLWVLADALNWVRLLVFTVLSVGAMVLWLIVSHRLWEAGQGPATHQQTVLFNAATTLTLLLGAASLYAAVFALTIGTAALVIDPEVLGKALGHHADLGDYAVLAWMASSLATIAGGLGAGLESDKAVREAAYGYRVERASERDSRSIESAVDESNRPVSGVGSG